MENRSHALAAGLFVILFGVASVVGLWWLGQSGSDAVPYMLETRRSVTGLNPQATVRYRGIRAGRVERIDTDPADPRVIRVEISVDSRFRLTRATTARLGYVGVTGLAYVQLEDDGSSDEPLKVDAGGTDPPRIALKPGAFDSLGERAGELLSQLTLVSGRLAALLDERNTARVAQTLDNVATASAGLREVPAILAALREATGPESRERLQRLLAHLERTAGAGAPLVVEARELVQSMNRLAQRAEGLTQQVGDELGGGTLERANALLREMTLNARQLSGLLERLDNNPQMLLFGRQDALPGPGEPGFRAPER